MRDILLRWGLSEAPSIDEIKRKYKELAKKYHPDISKEPDANEKFLQVRNDYVALLKYFNGDNVTAEDLNIDFDEHIKFNNTKVGSKGDDIYVTKHLTQKEMVKGSYFDVTYSRFDVCDKCNGFGSTGNSIQSACVACNATGYINGTVCTKCYGSGITFLTNCTECKGSGVVQKNVTKRITLPKTIKSGSKLKSKSCGNAGYRNAESGDLYITVLSSDSINKTEHTLNINLYQAIVGFILKVNGFDVSIFPNTHDGQLINLPNGDTVKVKISDVSMNSEQAKLFENWAKSMGYTDALNKLEF